VTIAGDRASLARAGVWARVARPRDRMASVGARARAPRAGVASTLDQQEQHDHQSF
jgi:hypothetical protein